MLYRTKVTACAKLNLSLSVTGRRDDGYHLLDMIMQSITLRDAISFEQCDRKGISLSSNFKYIPTDGKNLVVKAANALAERYGIEPSLRIYIEKSIPSQSGMGGGSADAAAALIALNRMWELDLNTDKLCEIGFTLGSDVPFMIEGGTKRVKGTGEILETMPKLRDGVFLIAIPKYGNSTKDIFTRFDSLENPPKPDVDEAVGAASKQDIKTLAEVMDNSLYAVAKTEDLEKIRLAMLTSGAFGAMMTGSGSSMFGVFPDYRSASEASGKLSKLVKRFFIVRPCDRCVSFVNG